jgi:hypothetical protein
MQLSEKLTLDEVRQMLLEDILISVSSENRTVTVKLPDNTEVVIQPGAKLKPLPVFEGYVPDGWKETIYHEAE